MDRADSSGAEGMLGQRNTASGCNAQSRITVTGFISNGVCTKEGCSTFEERPTLSTISFLAVFETVEYDPKGSSAGCEFSTK